MQERHQSQSGIPSPGGVPVTPPVSLAAKNDATPVLDRVTDSPVRPSSSLPWLDEFNTGQMPVSRALGLWLGNDYATEPGQKFSAWKRDAAQTLSWHIAEIDRIVSDQLNAVLHHPRFQKLESSWRGIEMLVNAADEEGGHGVMLKMLSVTWREIQRDFERSNEFDNSDLFKKIYEDEFGSPGGIPYSVLIGDYEIHPRPTAEHPFDDIGILGNLAGLAAAAFCPFVCAASPALFGVDSFLTLERDVNLAAGFRSPEFVKWRSLRKTEDARFVGLALPRILMREPYDNLSVRGFCFREEVAGADVEKYLWGNASFAWAQVLIRSFQESGWLADIRGTERNRDGGGLITTLPSISFGTDRAGVSPRSSTDLIVTDRQEAEFSRLGFLPICQCHGTPYAAYYSSQSIQEAAVYDSEVATANANISAMLQYILCVSRFAHYLKVIMRDVVGGAREPEEIQSQLDAWIKNYVTPDDSARPETKAQRPLREAEVMISGNPGKPGSYICKFNLLPHYQLDELTASIRMQTTIENQP